MREDIRTGPADILVGVEDVHLALLAPLGISAAHAVRDHRPAFIAGFVVGFET